ncbi:hypothetical protein XSR1_20072 [Xenorhabdus szentirmaii DSM 16338]|uniref:Uncharacterized protein n=1 Tax=Xenorhabdus szentirmaii DSM 16338 TaxID=1427518 RepID=W1IX97_9GAMM|nr:hypothetical protein XSR1_20072 [Xenorhabdus szentirmaii DSM 16338]
MSRLRFKQHRDFSLLRFEISTRVNQFAANVINEMVPLSPDNSILTGVIILLRGQHHEQHRAYWY